MNRVQLWYRKRPPTEEEDVIFQGADAVVGRAGVHVRVPGPVEVPHHHRRGGRCEAIAVVLPGVTSPRSVHLNEPAHPDSC